MNRSRFPGSVSVALGLILVFLSMGTFITEAKAACCDGIPSCLGTPASGCAAGTCTAAGAWCLTCLCLLTYDDQRCLCQ